MSEAVTLDRLEGLTMLLLRGDLGAEGPGGTAARTLGLSLPEARQARIEGGRGMVWMAPDEALIFLGPDEGADGLEALSTALDGAFAQVSDMSDARVGFDLSGPWAAEVLAKLMPLDLDPARFGAGQAARSHLGQIAAAVVCLAPGRFRLLCFRSVADYAEALLHDAIAAGPVGHFARA